MNIRIGIKINSRPFSLLTRTAIPVSKAFVELTIARKPPKIRMNIPTSTASANPNIRVSDKDAPTTPLPSTNLSPTNSAAGKKCETIARMKISIKIIVNADNETLNLFFF